MAPLQRVWFFYDNERLVECTSVILTNDQAQSAIWDDLIPSITERISMTLETPITRNLNFWKVRLLLIHVHNLHSHMY